MPPLFKSGRIAILLQGRMAGKKAVVVKVNHEGTKVRPYGHCLVIGLEKVPLKITNRMSQKKIKKRSNVKSFVRYVNFNHLAATRYSFPADIEAKTLVTEEQMTTKDGRIEAKKAFRKVMESKFERPNADKTGKAASELVYLRNKLRF